MYDANAMTSALFLAFLACALVTIAGRDQLRVARLSHRLGPGPGLFAAIWASALLASGVAAWAAGLIAPLLFADAKLVFAALALGLAAAELLVLKAGRAPKEPTRSAGAIFLVLAVSQTLDAARFIVLALAVATAEPWAAAIGGALGSGAAMSLGALAGGAWEERIPLRLLASGVAAILMLAAIICAMVGRGIIA